ncbi:hypothetical protein [Nostoc sp.]|uniref:hypothetical protein n=1 Tax=Nostoc sp. TaxID=1180 RepID=UPI002FF89954
MQADALQKANRIRYYTNEVHLSCGTLRERGLRENQRFLTHGGGFCLSSRDF